MAQNQADHPSRLHASDKPERAPSKRRGRQQSIKRRVVRLVLIPSVVAMVIWLVASGYLVFQGFYNREVANSVRQVSIPAVPALASIQQERRLSVAYLAQPSTELQGLLEQRRRTDELLSALRSAASSALANAPRSIETRWAALTDQLDQLPNVRSTIDSRTTDGTRIYGFYNQLLDAATTLFDTQARVVPDVDAAQGGIAATETFRASDLMSRSGSIIDGAFGSRALSQQNHLEFVRLVGAYHSALDNVAPHLQPDARRQYEGITASESWQRLLAAENELIGAGAWTDGVPAGLPVNRARWEALTRQVSADLVALTIAQADQVSAQALRTGNTQLLTATLGSLIALTIAIAAILWAVRQSQVLVDRALSVRLAQLGKDAAVVVDERLPAIMERLRRHEKVDLNAELPNQNYGSDEIGQVADVINRSLQAAAAAAVDEAKTRAAGVAMLMGVARRPQRPLQRGLKVIEDLQNRIGDEKLLTELFDINHQLTQTRRFLENLVILAGGQIGRRFQNPVPVRRVMLAAFAEAQHYQRITLRSAPDVALLGHSVAGTIHLLAELLDNALAFSPPGTTVWVTCNEVKRGVAVEIEDAGVGMKPDALEHANELLATAPTPDVTALKDGAQIGLHVVAELAKRDGIQVSLRTSAYGGLLAIVLLPERIITAIPADGSGRGEPAARRGGPASPASGDVARHDPRVAAVPGGKPALNGAARAANPHPVDGRRPDRAGGMMNDQRPISQQQTGNGFGAPRQRESAEVRTADAGPTDQWPTIPGPAAARPPVAGPGAGTPPVAGPDTRAQTSAAQSSAAPSIRQQDGGPSTMGPQVAGPPASAGAPHDSRPPLPHRQPQQHLVPQLRDENPTADGTPGTGAARSPEEARSRFSQYQQAWAAGRAADATENATIDDQGRKA